MESKEQNEGDARESSLCQLMLNIEMNQSKAEYGSSENNEEDIFEFYAGQQPLSRLSC